METLSSCNSAAASLKCDLMTLWSSEPLPRWENASVAPPRSLERAKLSLWSTAHSCLRVFMSTVPSSVIGSAGLRGQVEKIMIHLTFVPLVRCARVKIWPNCAWPNMRARVRLLKRKALHVWKALHGSLWHLLVILSVSNGNRHRFPWMQDQSQPVSLFHPGVWSEKRGLARPNGWDQ